MMIQTFNAHIFNLFWQVTQAVSHRQSITGATPWRKFFSDSFFALDQKVSEYLAYSLHRTWMGKKLQLNWIF